MSKYNEIAFEIGDMVLVKNISVNTSIDNIAFIKSMQKFIGDIFFIKNIAHSYNGFFCLEGASGPTGHLYIFHSSWLEKI